MYGGHRNSAPAEKSVPGEEDLFLGAIEVASLLRSLSRERKICFWGP